MRHISFVVVIAAIACSAIVGESDARSKETNLGESIVFFDGGNNRLFSLRNAVGGGSSSIVLDSSKEAYVLNKASFNRLDSNSAKAYLSDGGTIMVDDNSVTSKDLREKIDTSVASFDFSGDDSNYGFCLKNNDDGKTMVINVNAGYVSPSQSNDNSSAVVSVSKHAVALSAISSRLIDSHLSYYVGDDSGGGSSGQIVDTSTSGKNIAYAYMENILYYDGTNTKVCSYTTYTNVFDVAKVRDSSSGDICGIYDVSTKFTVDAEPSFAVSDYSVRMRSVNTVLDASYLNSSTSTTVSLTAAMGFQGDVLQGSVAAGYSYTYNPDSQEITNDLPAGKNKQWSSTVISPKCNASRILQPAIRILNSPDSAYAYEMSRVESFNVTDYRYLFPFKATMMDKYRKESQIRFDKYGNVTQTVNVG